MSINRSNINHSIMKNSSSILNYKIMIKSAQSYSVLLARLTCYPPVYVASAKSGEFKPLPKIGF